MKIAFIVNGFPSLSETFILNQITGLLDLGFDVDIFAQFNPNEGKIHSDVKKYRLMDRVYYFNPPYSKIKRILKAIYLTALNFYKGPAKILRAFNIFKYGKESLSLNSLYRVIPFLDKNFDIIHCHFGISGIVGEYLREMKVRGKIITAFYGYDLSAAITDNKSIIYKNLFIKGDLFLPICEYFKKKLINIECDEEKIKIHHMGIDLQKFKLLERKIQSKEDIKILTIARLIEKKGHIYAIKTIEKVSEKHKNIQYYIVGNGPLKEKLEAQVLEAGIKDNVTFLESANQDECIKLYEEAHIFLLPSVTSENGDQEGTPVVLMEAQATGLPVISTYHSGIPEVVIDGKSGFLVPEKDVTALAEKLKYLIEHPETRNKMGKAGRQHIDEKYNIHKLNQKLVTIYENLLEPPI